MRVSTLFHETDIREALSELIMQTGINIIYDDTVTGTVTLDLDDVPFEQALEMILMGGGFSYRKVDDYYLVGLPDPRSSVFQEMAVTETVELNYVTAADAAELLPNFYSDFIQIPSEGHALTITAPPEIIERFKADLEAIDTTQQEVVVQAVITEVSTEALDSLGGGFLEWSTDGMPDWDSDGFFSIASPSSDTVALETTLFGNLEAELRALEEDGMAEIHANPKIRTADRNTADLFVGDTRHITLTPEEGTSRLETVDVGIALQVTPRVLDNDRVQLEVEPEVSHVTDERDQDLVVRRSEIATTIFVEDGQTAVLAGMTVEDILEQESKVPILGDIPLLRLFFRETTERVRERELLVFISAEIMEKGR